MNEKKGDFSIVKITLLDNSELDNKVIIIPEKYVNYNCNIPQYYVKYLSPPHSKDDLKFIEEMVRRQVLPIPESWMIYECDHLAYADTYEDAKLILQKYMDSDSKKKSIIKPESSDSNLIKNKRKRISSQIESKITSIVAVKKSKEENKKRNVLNNSDDFSANKNEDDLEELFSVESITNASEVNNEIMSSDKCEVPELAVVNLSNLSSQDDTLSLENSVLDITQDILKKSDLEELKKSIIRSLRSEFITVNGKLNNIQTQLSEIQTSIANSQKLTLGNDVLTLQAFQDMYEYDLPFKTVNDFTNFELDLKDKKKTVNENLVLNFKSSVNTNKDLVEVVTSVFKSFFTRDVLINFTAQKKQKDKLIFKDTCFYNHFKEVLLVMFNTNNKTIDEILIKQAIGIVLNNAKDWDGYRRKRELDKNKFDIV